MEVKLGIRNPGACQERSWLSEGSKEPQGTPLSMGDEALPSGMGNLTDKQLGNSLGIVEMKETKPDRRICLASIDTNVQKNMVRESQSLSIKRGGKWVRLQRDKLENGDQKKAGNSYKQRADSK